MAGRPPTPAAILEARGSFKHDPQRARVDLDGGAPIGEPPPHLGGGVLHCWNEIVRDAPPGILRAADRYAIERAANLMFMAREDPAGFSAAHNGQLMKFFIEFGMTPSPRARIGGSKPEKQKNSFSGLDD